MEMGGTQMIKILTHIKHNWGAKILAVLAAIVMWFFIMREQNPVIEASYTIPVQVQNLNVHYVADGLPHEIRVQLKGPRNTILTMNDKLMKAYIDLAEVKPGQSNIPIIFTPPSGTTVADMSPETVTVTIDEYAERTVPVEIIQIGKLPDDMAVQKITVMPKTVLISGPKAKVNKVAHVILKVNMSEQTKSFTQTGKLEAVDIDSKTIPVTISPTQGQAQFELTKIRTEKAFPITANVVGVPADGCTVKATTVTPAQITIYGKEELLNSMTDIKTQPIDISGVESTVEGTYNLLLPSGLTSAITTVKVKIEIIKDAMANSYSL